MLLKAGMYGHYLEATISLKFQRRKFQNHIKGTPSSLDILLYFLVFELLITKITTKVLCGVSGWQKSALKFLIFRHFEMVGAILNFQPRHVIRGRSPSKQEE